MKVQVDRKTLQSALRTASAVVPKRSPLPILECVRIEASQDAIRLTCTDAEAEITVTVPASVTEPGIIVTPAKFLATALKEEKSVTVSLENNRLGTTPLVTDNDKLPRLTPAGNPVLFTLPSTEGVRYAMAKNNARRCLNGLCIDLRSDDMRLIATDGHRLALATFPGAFESPRKAVIPQNVVNLLPKAEVQVALHDGFAVFTYGATTLITRLIEDRYVRADSVLKGIVAPIRSVTVPRDALLDAAKKAVALGDRSSKDVPPRILLTFSNSNLETALYRNGEQMVTHIACDYFGTDEKLCLDATYLVDCVKALNEPVVIDVCHKQAVEPLVFRQENTTHLIMPVRI